jgi:hypothetical protein
VEEWLTVEFIGGPLDGTGKVHPTMNCRLTVKENPEGVYIYNGQVYVWTTRDNDSNAERASY